ncbi:MAG: WYL domain-containing protein [Mangrovibacterium sp.]
MKPEKVVLFVNRKHAPYVLTKPFHPSQKLVEKNEYGITISLEVQLNFELEKEIMGLGDGIVVLEPERLRSGIAEKLNNAIDLYNTTIPAKGIVSLKQKYFHKGFCVINQLFSHRSIMQLGSALSGKSGETGNKERSFSIDLNTSNPVKSLLFPPPVWKTLSLIVGNPGIKTAMYWGYVPESFCEYSQLMTSGTILFIVALSGLKPGTLTLQLIPGSHNKQLSDEEKQCITGNCIPVDCPINSAGAILLNPAVLHRFHPSFKNAPVKFVVIEMTYKE